MADWRTSLTEISPNRILVRGYALDELMGKVGFGDAIHLLLTGELPSSAISRLIDAMLVSFIDHGVSPPSTLATRNAATTGSSLRSAVASGILAFGRHHGGDILACRMRLDEALTATHAGGSMQDAADTLTAQLLESAEIPPPGFGHRMHTKDPRAGSLLLLAHELGFDGPYMQMLRAIERSLAKHPTLASRPMPINIDGAIAAVCGDIGLPPETADALLLISRVPGLAAHALEEQGREIPMRTIDPARHHYDGPPERRLTNRR